jgi:tetratricopeptide (TPR) repeat protein
MEANEGLARNAQASPFVARESELESLNAALRQAPLAGKGGVRFIRGEAGSGKTTLITEFTRRAQRAHAELVVAAGICNAQTGIGDPYLPFREILQLLTGNAEGQIADGALTRENTRRLQGLARVSTQALVEIGPDLIGVFLPGVGILAKVGTFVADKAGLLEGKEGPGVVPEPEEIDESHIFEQYAGVLRQLTAHRPLVLVLDDLQWADQASVALLFYLIRELRESPVLILGLYRPTEVSLGREGSRHPLAKVLADVKRYYGDVTLDLDQTSDAEGRHFVDAFLDTEPNRLGEEFRAALYAHTQGQPLFTVELLRVMQERGDLVQDESGAWVQGEALNWTELPSRVEGVIEERVERLEDDLKGILRVASVEGQEFTAQVIARLKTLDELELFDRLHDELEQKHNLIHEQGERDVGSHILDHYRFTHNLFQQHLYHRELSRAQRRKLHSRIGSLLENLYGEELDAVVLQLARHFEEASLWKKAVDYRLRAGEHARRLCASEDAIEHFERTLALVDRLPAPDQIRPRLHAHAALGELLTTTGQYEGAREHLRMALSMAQDAGDRDGMAHVCRWLGWGYENQAAYESALEWVERGLQALDGCETAEAVQLRLLAGLTYLRLGKVDEALDEAQVAFEVAQGLGDRRTLGRTYLLLAVITLQRGQNDHSVELARRALELYTQAGDLAGQAKAHNQIANALFNMGHWTQAAERYGEARDVFQRIGDLYNRALVENNLGEIALNQGRLGDALTAYREALRIMEGMVNPSTYILGILHNNLGAVLVRQGALEAARDQLERSRARFEEAGSRDILPELHRHRAELALRRQRLAEARRETERSLALARELRMQNEAGITLRLLGEIELGQGNLRAAAEFLGESLSTLQGLGEAFQIARTRLALARLALALRREGDARAELDKCEPVFERLDMGEEERATRQLRATLAE